MSRVVVIGDALIDELRDDRGVREFVGGAALNVAVGLRLLGVPTTLWAALGEDADGARVRSYLETFGVPLRASPAPQGTGRAVSTRVGGAEPDYVFNATAREAIVEVGAEERAALAATPAVIISGIGFDSPEQMGPLLDALPEMRRLIVDPNPRGARLRDARAFREGLLALAAHAELVKIGDDDATMLGWDSTAAAAARLREAGAPAVLMTHGAGGAGLVAAGTAVTAAIATFPAPIIDTMGAGDATLASVVRSLLADSPNSASGWQRALELAMQVAAATCRHEGALLREPREPADPADRIDT